MPGLARKLLIFAAVDGLVLQPLGQRGQRPAPAAKIAYKDNSIGSVLKDGGEGDGPGRSFEAFGIVGKLEEEILRRVYPPPCVAQCAGTTGTISLESKLLTLLFLQA
jgi:hypothetical protein